MIAAPPPPTPVQGMAIVGEYETSAAPRPARPRRITPPVVIPVSGHRRRVGAKLPMLVVTLLVLAGTSMTVRGRLAANPAALEPIRVAPAMVLATLRLDGALVRGAARNWALNRSRAARYGEPVPVQLTAYCLQGTTRRDRYVRQGIVAADPRVFPLGRYVELYVGRDYYGRFLVDDTGSAIRDAILDIWTPACRDARRFGRQRGTAVLVPRPRGAAADTLLTGRLGGAEKR